MGWGIESEGGKTYGVTVGFEFCFSCGSVESLLHGCFDFFHFLFDGFVDSCVKVVVDGGRNGFVDSGCDSFFDHFVEDFLHAVDESAAANLVAVYILT